MNNEQSKEYQLEIKKQQQQELIEQREFEISERFTATNKKIFDKIKSYKSDASAEVKLILAMNEVFERVFSQHDSYPLQGFEKALSAVRNPVLLANNNFVYGDNLATESAVYLLIESEVLDTHEDGLAEMSNLEKIQLATEIYELDKVPYKLYLYLNTDKYDEYISLMDDLKATVTVPYEIVSSLGDMDFMSRAEVIVDTLPTRNVHELVTQFITTFNLLPQRRKSIYFSIKAEELSGIISPLDFHLLSTKNLMKVLIKPEHLAQVADHVTDLWFGTNPAFKFRHEEIEDFFKAPTAVLVRGLSPVYGVIVGRKLIISGARLSYEHEKEELIKFEIDDYSEIYGLFNEEELYHYLKRNPANLRSNLIRWKNDVIRVTSIEKSISVQGKNLSSSIVSTYTLTGDLSKVTLLTDFYNSKNHNSLQAHPKAVPYSLPEQFNMYLLRKALRLEANVPEVDTTWFSKANSSLEQVLEQLSDRFYLDDILQNYISPVHGIQSRDILVSLEGIKCRTKGK